MEVLKTEDSNPGCVKDLWLEQLSVCLWRHNARTFLHLFSLLPGSPLWELNSVSCSHSLQFGQ